MKSNGLATILLLIPVLTVPALAIFGIPQFAPVVASPLDEGREKARESRTGSSARNSHDELFGDVEGFGSEPGWGDDASPKRRDPTSEAGFNRRVGDRSQHDAEEAIVPDWGEEPIASDWPTKSRSRAGSFDRDVGSIAPQGIGRPAKKRFVGIKPNPDRRQLKGYDDALRTANADDGILQMGHQEEVEIEEKPQRAAPLNRTRMESSGAAKKKESAGETLTWQNAVQRLNELEIRSFRLEPGHQVGQFVFICSYTPPDTPRVSYRFEAESDQPLKAVEKVLEQIMERQRR